MSVIKCEMCGSNRLIKIDGVYQCEFCGTKYTPEEAKKLIVSGTVEVVKGNAEKDRLIKNAEYFIDNNQLKNALDTIEKLKFDFPAELEILELEKKYSLAKSLNDFEFEKDTIIKLLDLYLSGSNYCTHKIDIHFNSINLLRKRILDLNNTYNTFLNDKENEIITNINNKKQIIIQKKLKIFSEIINWSSGIINEEYHTKFVTPPKIYSDLLSSWINELTKEIVSLIRNGKYSFMSLYFSNLCDVFKEIPKRSFSETSNKKLLLLINEGCQCGRFLDTHFYIFEDVISNMEQFSIIRSGHYYGAGSIEYALGNEFIYLADNEYGPVYKAWETKIPIKNIKNLNSLADSRNPNNYCTKCGSKLVGFFTKKCSRCNK